ncbi:MAG: hypothetical protein ABS76_37205 [Pelagibacterium sp. SCN 64-44]|nr:MAG: hypothetical protein ABS76_37205 [Pelagibacterium sp. SCN 64-44]
MPSTEFRQGREGFVDVCTGIAGRPTFTPRRFAAAMPAFVCSRISSRSPSASVARMPITVKAPAQ